MLIHLEDLSRAYSVGETSLQVLKGINLTIEAGEFVAVMGPSGSGKSTLMQILGLLDRPTAGRYRLMGRDVSRLSDDEGAALRSKTIGFVFQMFNLLPRTSALDNVMLPLIYSGNGHRGDRGRELLREVGLGDRMEHKPNQLSGGQQQRVAIARALMNRPQIVFADEPTGNLASAQAEEILGRLTQLNRQGITVIMVTHEPEIAAFARRRIHLKDGLIVADERDSRVVTSAAVSDAARGTGESPADLEAPQFHVAEVREYVKATLRATAANKVRSGLSVLGILIGVAAVISMLALGKGAEEAIQARLRSLGTNVVMMFPGNPRLRGIAGGMGASSRLTLEDAKAVRKASPHILDLYPEVEGNFQVIYNSKNTKVELQGVTPSYESIRNAPPYYGRFFTQKEDSELARVALIGQTVVSDLFGAENPVGKRVRIGPASFEVIGVLPVRGSAGSGDDQDALVIAPLHTAAKRLLGSPYLHEMAIQCDEPENIPLMMADVEALMRKRHRLPAYKENDFTLRSNAERQAALSGTTKTFAAFLGAVAAISLLVGGVGIMNIMLVSVNERTREIGLRKAVGAARRAIRTQFLMEASLLSVMGGALGVAVGAFVSLVLTRLAGWAAIVTPESVLLAFAFSAGVGVVFGFWPAYKASLLSPIEALRYE